MSRWFNGGGRPPPRSLLPLASAAALLAMLGAARAEEFCARIDQLIDHSRSGFVEIAAGPAGDAGHHATKLTLAGASHCAVTRKPTGSWYQCAWAFPLRDKRASDTFDALAGQLAGCLARRATLHSDRGVNHPDSYTARRYELVRAEVSLSVKDKAALGKTFVFIRVRGRNGG